MSYISNFSSKNLRGGECPLVDEDRAVGIMIELLGNVCVPRDFVCPSLCEIRESMSIWESKLFY